MDKILHNEIYNFDSLDINIVGLNYKVIHRKTIFNYVNKIKVQRASYYIFYSTYNLQT